MNASGVNIGRLGGVRLGAGRGQVVGMDVVAGGDGLRRQADGLAVLDDSLAGRDHSQGNFVTERHGVAQDERRAATESKRRPGRQIGQGNGDVILFVEAKESRRYHVSLNKQRHKIEFVHVYQALVGQFQRGDDRQGQETEGHERIVQWTAQAARHC